MFPQDKLCHYNWSSHFDNKLHSCLSPDTHPYMEIAGNDKNIYYWCKKHAAMWTKFRQMTHDEVTILEVLET